MNAFLIIAALLPSGADPASEQLILKDVIAAAERTALRLQSEGAAWNVTIDLPGGGSVEVAVEQFPETSRHELKVIAAGRSETVATLIARDGTWFVDDGQSRGRYRPFEAPFPLPTAVLFLAASDLQIVAKEALNGNAVVGLEQPDNRRLIVRMRGSDIQNENLRSMIAKVEELGSQLKAAGKPLPTEQVRQMDELKERLSKGFPVTVDRETGVILDRGLAPKEVHIRGFAWKGPGASPKWEIEPREWEDYTQPLSAEELKDVIQIGHSRIWRPGTPSGDTDLTLLNVRNGKVRRVPFPFGVALSGCFSSDRTKVYVSGTKFDDASVALFEINLMTGETIQLGDESLRRGIWLGPVLSPDGRFLAAVQLLQGSGLGSQIHVIDLQTSTSRAVGEPIDAAFLAWHPDGSSLFCALREPDPTSKFPKSFITQISLDGTTRKLREGGFPCLLPTVQRFLFEDAHDDRRLKTCDLEGRDVRPFGDGFKGFGFPAPSPDGRLLMMKFVTGKAPQPCLIDLDSYRVTPIEVGPGMWGRPAWK